jgi:hypothetical protein
MTSLIALTLLAAAPASQPSVYELSNEAFVETARHDLQTLKQFVAGMSGVMAGVGKNKPLFSLKANQVYSPEQKQTLLSTWGSLFAYFSATEGLRQKYWDFVKVAPTDPKHAWGFLLTHTALTALLANGLKFAELALNNKQLETLFDEANDEYGVPQGAFAAFKMKAIHVATSTQLLTGDTYAVAAVPFLKKQKAAADEPAVAWAVGEMKADSTIAKSSLVKSGSKLFLGNAKDIVADSSAHAIFPAQKTFAEWAGDTKVARIGKPLVTAQDIEKYVLPVAQPGDIVVSRQNWFLSNIGLPGFWPHAQLYVGTAAELAKAFDTDPEVVKWTQAQPEKAASYSALLEKRYPAKWKTYASGPDFQGHSPIRVIESISEGVSFTAVEHAFGVDYLAMMRPRVSLLDKAKAIERAFKYQGRPYDFDFDFFSDATIVCSELVYKSYQPGADKNGVTIDLVDVAGRRTLPANEIVKRFDSDATAGKPQMDFVFFLDGNERENKVVPANEAAFRASWKRTKWDIAQK